MTRARPPLAPDARRAALAAGPPASPRGSQGGQASIELLGVLPLTVALTLGVTQALFAGYAGQLAGHAAEAAAITIQAGGDADDAQESARAALPDWGDRRVRVTVRGRRVTVHLRPPSLVAPLSRALEADRTADAGPRP